MYRYNKTIQKKNVTKENIKQHNPNWPQIPDDSYRTLIVGGSRSGQKIIIITNKSSTRY